MGSGRIWVPRRSLPEKARDVPVPATNRVVFQVEEPRGKERLSPLKLDAYVVLVDAAAQGQSLDLDAICSHLPDPATTAARRRAVENAMADLCCRGLVARSDTMPERVFSSAPGVTVALGGQKGRPAQMAAPAEKGYRLTGAGCAAAKNGHFKDLNPDETSVVQTLLSPPSRPCSRQLTTEEIVHESGLDDEQVNQSINTLAASGWIAERKREGPGPVSRSSVRPGTLDQSSGSSRSSGFCGRSRQNRR